MVIDLFFPGTKHIRIIYFFQRHPDDVECVVVHLHVLFCFQQLSHAEAVGGSNSGTYRYLQLFHGEWCGILSDDAQYPDLSSVPSYLLKRQLIHI